MESVISLLVLFGTCFSSTDILKTHTCKIKELSDEKTDPKYTEACDLCTRRYISIRGLNAHKRAVHEGIVFYCPICRDAFSRQVILNQHVAIVHLKENPFI